MELARIRNREMLVAAQRARQARSARVETRQTHARPMAEDRAKILDLLRVDR
jgi:hypothetical protein